MLFGVLCSVVFAGITVGMVVKGNAAWVRRMAIIPACMAVMELAMAGVWELGSYPVLTAVLMVCRAAVLVCCVLARKRDVAVARNRRRRREVLRRVTRDFARDELAPLRRCA